MTGAPALPLAFDGCESEPIHVPGSIQPHGVLLALHGPGLTITQAATSCRQLLGVAAEELLGRALAALDPGLAVAVGEALTRYRELPDVPASFRWTAPHEGRHFVGHVHEPRPLVVLELELAAAADLALPEAVEGFTRAARQARTERDLEGKTREATAWIRRLTGYDRVLVYRFHEDLHGEVIAEARRADQEPFLGLHYPASDIPAQARRLYVTSPTRLIPDVNAAPSPLVPVLNPVTGRPLDLSLSQLRSVSPVHLEYLRNMGVGASLTASLLRDGQLWGLVSCHHESPRSIPAAARTALEWMVQDLATQIALVEDSLCRSRSAHLGTCRGKVFRAVEGGARLPDLVRGPALADLLGLVGADGVAVLVGTTVTTGGATPEPDQILALVDGLCGCAPEALGQVFATDGLGRDLPALEHLAAVASGVVVLPLGAAQPLRIVWFRGEQRRLVRWGGDPDKAVEFAPDGRLLPRRSFAVWAESVRGRSLPWQTEEIDSVKQLGAVIELECRRMVEDALHASEDRHQGVLDSLPSSIAVLDRHGMIVSVNQAWRRFAQQNSGDERCLPGANYLAVCRSAYGEESSDALAALTGIVGVLSGARDYFSMEYPCPPPASAAGVFAENWFVLRVFPLTGLAPGAVVAHEDITLRKQTDRALRQSEARYRQLNSSLEERVERAVTELRSRDQLLILQSRQAAMGEMLGNIAHQWRQPLNALSFVLANLRDAARHGELDDRAVEEAVGDGTRIIQRMSSTIDDFRDFFRPDKEKTVFSALAEVRKTLALIEASYQHARVALVVEALEDLSLFGFPNEFSQVLLNLLSNAKQAILVTRAEGGQVRLRLERREGLGCLVVRDNGGGFPEAIAHKIFEPYFSTHNSSGIGLYMSRKIAEKSLGGRLEARNVGEGAEFSLLVPLAPEAAQ